MNRSVVNNTESVIRVIVIEPGTWDIPRRRIMGGGPRELARVAPGCTYVVPPELESLPLLVESPAHLCSRTTVALDPSVFGKSG